MVNVVSEKILPLQKQNIYCIYHSITSIYVNVQNIENKGKKGKPPMLLPKQNQHIILVYHSKHFYMV